MWQEVEPQVALPTRCLPVWPGCHICLCGWGGDHSRKSVEWEGGKEVAGHQPGEGSRWTRNGGPGHSTGPVAVLGLVLGPLSPLHPLLLSITPAACPLTESPSKLCISALPSKACLSDTHNLRKVEGV